MKEERKWILLALVLSLVIGMLSGAGVEKRVLAEDGSTGVMPSMRMKVDKNEIVAGEMITVSIFVTGEFNVWASVFGYDTNIFESPLLEDNEGNSRISGTDIVSEILV